MFNWFTEKEPTSEDMFRVRTVIAKNGKKTFFPEYKPKGFSRQWGVIVLINSRSYRIYDASTNDPEFSVLSEEEAQRYCSAYKDKLTYERGNEFGEEIVTTLSL